MKLLLLGVIFLAFYQLAGADSLSAPDLAEITRFDAVYLVRAESETTNREKAEAQHLLLDRPNFDEAIFSVLEVLRGPKQSSMALTVTDRPLRYLKSSEWILLHNASGFKGRIGWTQKGYCEWLPVSMDSADRDRVFGYRFSLDQIKAYLRIHPPESK